MTLQETLDFYNIDKIWHFTDVSNVPSILEHGLLSLHMIEKFDINVSCFGADKLSHDLDRHYGLDKFIHLSFIKEHPMCYIKKLYGDIPNPVWLAIDVSILFDANIYFATDVANKSGVSYHNIKELEQKADIEVLWGKTNWSDPKIKERRLSAKRGEIMIPNKIKLENILEVA